MRPLPQLDFMAAPPRPWSGLALLAVAALILAAAAASCWQIEQGNRYETALLNQRAARQAMPQRKPTEAERLRQAQTASVSGQLRAPWAELLATFEESGRSGIGLLKLEPDARTGVVRVTGHARDAKALFAYLQDLEADPRLLQVVLNTHQRERDTPGQPLRFIIQATWRTATTAPTAPKVVS